MATVDVHGFSSALSCAGGVTRALCPVYGLPGGRAPVARQRHVHVRLFITYKKKWVCRLTFHK